MRMSCPTCVTATKRSEKYDAHFCVHCDVWIEEQCGGVGCEFCENRPEKPSMADPDTNWGGDTEDESKY